MKLKNDSISKILISLFIINLITACGQKGDLIRPLPKEQKADVPKTEESQ